VITRTQLLNKQKQHSSESTVFTSAQYCSSSMNGVEPPATDYADA